MGVKVKEKSQAPACSGFHQSQGQAQIKVRGF